VNWTRCTYDSLCAVWLRCTKHRRVQQSASKPPILGKAPWRHRRRPQHLAPPQIRFDLLLSSLSALDQAFDSHERVHVGGSQFLSPPLLEVFVSVGVPPFASIVSLMVVMRRFLGLIGPREYARRMA
jgi:hypothetical protein